MTDLSGHTLGKYQLIERLGRGGMANVYKAFQPGMERYVAIKVMHPHLTEDTEFISRFQREAREVAKLRHPNIVQIFDFDVQDENYYMVMEYVEGGTSLKEHLEELAGRGEILPLDITLQIITKLADALSYAHGEGMIHRDIKPANVLIPRIDQPLLSDFGIARLLGETGLTASGAMIGTPAYMSPEQGRGERADERSDIYALGIVLYEMITGNPPYNADTPYGVILKHINDPLIPPHSIIGTIPQAVERLVFKSLAKDPDQRYQTASEMHAALQETLVDIQDATFPGAATEALSAEMAEDAAETVEMSVASEPVTSPASAGVTAEGAATTPPETQKTRKRFGTVFALIVSLLVLAGATLGILALTGTFSDDQEEGETEAEFEVEEPPEIIVDEEAIEEAQSGEIFNDLEPLSRMGWEQMINGEYDIAREMFEQALVDNPEDVAALAGQARLSLSDENIEEAQAKLQQAQELDADHLLVHLVMAEFHREGRDYNPERTIDEYSIVIERCEENIIICQIAYQGRADFRGGDLGDYAGAIEDLSRAIEINVIDWKLPWIYGDRGEFYLYSGNPDAAIADYEKAYELDPSDGELLELAARASVYVRDYERAFGIYDRLLADWPEDPRFLVGSGYVEYRMGNLEAAQERANVALEINPDFMAAHYLIGLVQIEQGLSEEALGSFQTVLDSGLPDWEWGSPYFAEQEEFGHEIFYDMARAAYVSGQIDPALEFIGKSLETENWWPQPYILRGKIFREMGDTGGAREEFLQAREIFPDYEGLYPELEAELGELLDSLNP